MRLPEDLKVRVIELAEANGRSANAEMVAAIEAWVLKNKHVNALDITEIAERVIALENEIAQLKKKPT